MTTECNQQSFRFHRAGRREVVARFDGGHISSDGGGVLLREVERRARIVQQFAACFTDHRDASRIEHPLSHLIGQRVFGLALGYEDLNDHDTLRSDPMLAMMVGDDDPTGSDRRRKSDRGKALAGKSTLNRLELTPVGANEEDRYKKITCSMTKVQQLLVALFMQEYEAGSGGGIPSEIVLDIDATHDPIHGNQIGKFFHGYYDCHCYLPLYVMCGDFVLAAKLRPSNIDEATGSVNELSRIIEQIRAAPGWKDVQIIVRADSGFCRENLMNWCEANDVFYVLGLAKNTRLKRAIGKEMHQAKEQCEGTKQPARVFAELTYRTKKSWSKERRVVAKAEHLPGSGGAQATASASDDKANARFVVTNLSPEMFDARTLYESLYCARGDMENRIKEQQLCLFADRLSCEDLRANQIRLYFSTVAYTLLAALRRRALKNTELEHAQASTIRVRLLKIGVRIVVTARKLWLSLSQAFPLRPLFARIHAWLTGPPALTR